MVCWTLHKTLTSSQGYVISIVFWALAIDARQLLYSEYTDSTKKDHSS